MKTLQEFKEYIKDQMESAGEACMNSEGSQGCDEANYFKDILKDIERFENEA